MADDKLNVKVTELRGLVEAGELSRNAAIAKLYNFCSIYSIPVSERRAEELIDGA